jgi:hypothetical protein
MKITNPRMPLLMLGLAAVCFIWLAIKTGYARSGAVIRQSNHVNTASLGARWVWQNPLPQGNTLYGVSFTDANTGTATGDDGTIVRTTDGGNSWVIQSSGTTNTLYGVSFTDTNNGTAVGASGTILRTSDGGNTWFSQTSGTANGLLAVSFTNANTGTAVGENGTIVRFSRVWPTRFGSLLPEQTHGCRRPLFCQKDSAIYRPRPSVTSFTPGVAAYLIPQQY